MSAGTTTHALTIDVEDWYHVENLRDRIPPERWNEQEPRLERNVERLLSILEDGGTRATFFILGLAARRHPGIVRSIHDAGHEIGCHGWSHQLVYRQSPAEFREETRRAKRFLEELCGDAVRGYRASTFSITDQSLWALDILAGEGFEYDSSIAPLRHDRYGIPSAPQQPHRRELADGRSILEFPVCFGRLLRQRVPLGGGFFRLLPAAWTMGTLRAYEKRGSGGMIYLHPWEFDPDQPRVDGLGALRRFRHYTGLRTTEAKLRRVLESFRFGTMYETLRSTVD